MHGDRERANKLFTGEKLTIQTVVARFSSLRSDTAGWLWEWAVLSCILGNLQLQRRNIICFSDFSPEKLRSAVVVWGPERTDVVYNKGSPEMIVKFCQNVTVSADLRALLQQYTQQGLCELGYECRVLNHPENELKLAKQE